MTRLTDVLVSLSPTAAILLKISILLAVAWAAHAVLRISQADARWRLLLWRGVMTCLLLVPVVQWIGQWDVFVKRPVALRTETVVVMRSEPLVSLVQPIPSTSPAPTTVQMPPAPDNSNAFVRTPGFSFSTWAGERKPQLLLACWLIGAGVLLLRSFALLARIRRMRSGSRPAGPNFERLLEQVAREMGCRKPVLLRFAPGIGSPFLTGLWRLTIILPDRMEDGDYEEDLPGILAHEVAHIRTHDLWWMALGRFASTLFWFHPLAWRLRAAHCAACEEACDAAAAQYVGNPAAYTSTLARVALAIVRPVPSVGGIPMARSSQIISRLRLLERGVRLNPIRRGPFFLCAGLGIAVFAGVACVHLAYAQVPSDGGGLSAERTMPSEAASPASNPKEQPPQSVSKRYFVQLVVARDKMSFEGEEATREQLPKLLEMVPNRRQTVLQLAMASDQMTVGEFFEAEGLASDLVRRFGFAYLSNNGVHPLGSKGDPPKQLPAESKRGLTLLQYDVSDLDAEMLVKVMREFTGPENWDFIAVYREGHARYIKGSAEAAQPKGADDDYRTMYVRVLDNKKNWLMVNQVEAVHHKIEEMLKALRTEMTDMAAKPGNSGETSSAPAPAEKHGEGAILAQVTAERSGINHVSADIIKLGADGTIMLEGHVVVTRKDGQVIKADKMQMSPTGEIKTDTGTANLAQQTTAAPAEKPGEGAISAQVTAERSGINHVSADYIELGADGTIMLEGHVVVTRKDGQVIKADKMQMSPTGEIKTDTGTPGKGAH